MSLICPQQQASRAGAHAPQSPALASALVFASCAALISAATNSCFFQYLPQGTAPKV